MQNEHIPLICLFGQPRRLYLQKKTHTHSTETPRARAFIFFKPLRTTYSEMEILHRRWVDCTASRKTGGTRDSASRCTAQRKTHSSIKRTTRFYPIPITVLTPEIFMIMMPQFLLGHLPTKEFTLCDSFATALRAYRLVCWFWFWSWSWSCLSPRSSISRSYLLNNSPCQLQRKTPHLRKKTRVPT